MKWDKILDIVRKLPTAAPAGIPHVGPVMESIREQLSEEDQRRLLTSLKETNEEQLGLTREVKQLLEQALQALVSQAPLAEEVGDFPQLSVEVDAAWIDRIVRFSGVAGKRKFSCLIVRNGQKAKSKALECRAVLELVNKPPSTQRYHSLHWADEPYEPVQTAKPIDIGIGETKRLDIVFKPVEGSPTKRETMPDGASGPLSISHDLVATSGQPFAVVSGEAPQAIPRLAADAYIEHDTVKLGPEPEGCWIAEPYSLYSPSVGNQNYLPPGDYSAILTITYRNEIDTVAALRHRLSLVSASSVGKLNLELHKGLVNSPTPTEETPSNNNEKQLLAKQLTDLHSRLIAALNAEDATLEREYRIEYAKLLHKAIRIWLVRPERYVRHDLLLLKSEAETFDIDKVLKHDRLGSIKWVLNSIQKMQVILVV